MIDSIFTLMGLAMEICGSFILSIEAIGFGRIEGWIRSLKIVGFRATKRYPDPGELRYSNNVLVWVVGFPVSMTVFWLCIYLNIGWYSFILVLFGFVAIYILNRVVSVCLDRIAKLLKLLEEKTYQREAGMIGFLFLFAGFVFQFAGAFLPIIQSN